MHSPGSLTGGSSRLVLSQIAARMQELHDKNVRSGDEVRRIARKPISLVKQAGGVLVPTDEMYFEPSDVMERVRHSRTVDDVDKHLTAEYWNSAIALEGVSALENGGRHEEAVQVLQAFLESNLCPAERGKAYTRLCIDLEKHLGSKEKALRTAEEGLQDPWVSAGERFDLMRRVVALAKPPRRWHGVPTAFKHVVDWKPREIKSFGRPYNRKRSEKSRFANPADDDVDEGMDAQVRVESLVLNDYLAAGWKGMHAESGPIVAIFFLLFWDIIFQDTGRAFRHPCQTAPSDLGLQRFVDDRWDATKAKLARIRAGDGPALIEKTWLEKHGMLVRAVNWERHRLDDLVELAECIGAEALANLSCFFLRGFDAWSGGLPDLAVWRREPQKAAKLVEVKGPRDSLSQQQRAWLVALKECGIDADVAKVCEK